MASRQGAVKHGFVSKIAGGCRRFRYLRKTSGGGGVAPTPLSGRGLRLLKFLKVNIASYSDIAEFLLRDFSVEFTE